MQQKHFIDVHKGVTAIVILLFMAIYHQWHNATAWIYLALHGSYGFLWVLKSGLFHDKQWEEPCGLGYGLVICGGLTLYWIAPWLLMARHVHAPAWYLGMCVSLYVFGVFLHFASDMQKHMALILRPGELFTRGLWRHCRNPNYLGELLIYLGFGLLAMHWLPLVVIALFLTMVWVPNMFRKDRSLSRYTDFPAWRAHSWLLIPGVI